MDLKEVARFALDQGYFELSEADNDYGCDGIHCATPGNAFYFDAKASEYLTLADYLTEHTKDMICEKIGDVLNEMITEFPMEVELYFEEILYGYSHTEGIEKIKDLLTEAIKAAQEQQKEDRSDPELER